MYCGRVSQDRGSPRRPKFWVNWPAPWTQMHKIGVKNIWQTTETVQLPPQPPPRFRGMGLFAS